MSASRWIGSALLAAAVVSGPGEVVAQQPTGREAIEAIRYAELDFTPAEVQRRDVEGVSVLVLEDRQLPIVNVYAYFKGGYGLFPRESYAAAMGLPALMRNGGTMTIPPDSVEELLEFHAIQTTFGSAGGSVTSSLNTLTEHMDVAFDLWTDILVSPGFDTLQIEVWRGRQLESVRRYGDDPGRLAFSEFNHLLFGDHPIGWEMSEFDLAPQHVAPDRLREVHARVVCRENMTLGVTGDVEWSEIRSRLSRFVRAVPRCEGSLPDPPTPEVLVGAGVYVLEKDLDQSVVVMAHPTPVRLADDTEYFSAMIGNAILGAGGFSSRLLGRVRTEEGYAYSASSLWTTPRDHGGIVGAITRTSPETTADAIEVILATMEELTVQPPSPDEVGTAVDRIVNGFVFNFSYPGQIVGRTMAYEVQDLPADWLERYWAGVQRVTRESVLETFAEHLDPSRMTILVLGDPERIGIERLEAFGPVTFLESR